MKKLNDDKVTESFHAVVDHFQKHYPHVNIMVEEHVYERISEQHPDLTPVCKDDRALLADKTDFVVTLGGDGSILHVSSLFDQSAVPPVLSFSLGTLGFLLPYDIHCFPAALDDVLHSRLTLLLRMRMSMTLWDDAPGQCLLLSDEQYCREVHFMNEVVLHRGREPHMTTMDAYVNGEHLTRTIADGLILSTPTGSTAYSLSAGGPIIHPSVSTMMLTPISPRSLSFRTILFPSDATIDIFVSPKSRSPAEVSVDGREVRTLAPSQSARVQLSPYPLPCINFAPEVAAERRCGTTPESAAPAVVRDDWVHDINTLLRFNASFLARDHDIPSVHSRSDHTYQRTLTEALSKHEKKEK